MRLSIDITEAQHQAIKAYAVMHGMSIKDFVLERILTDELQHFNEATRQVLALSDQGKELHRYGSMESFISDMGDG